MLQLVDVVKDNLLKENMQLEVLYTIAKKADCPVNYLRLDIEKDVIDAEFGKCANFFCLHFDENTARYSYDLVRKIKSVNPSSNVCGVGYFATYAYKKILEECQEIDYIIMGEFEEPVLSMVRDFEAGKEIKYSEYLYCIVSQKDASNKKINRLDLKNYPKVLDRILLNKNKKIRIASVEGSRGCIGNCTFCAMNYRDDIKDVNWTGRDIKDILNEMIAVYEKYKIKVFLFADSAIEMAGEKGKIRLEQLCDLIIKSGYKFSIICNMRASGFKGWSDRLFEKIKLAGVSEILVGIESVNRDDQKLYNKSISKELIKKVIDQLNKNEIEYQIGFIFFNPLSTEESIKENYNFLKQNDLFWDFYFSTRLVIKYNTPIYFRLRDEKILKGTYSYINNIEYKYVDPNVEEMEKRILETQRLITYIEYENRYMDFDRMYKAVMKCSDKNTLSLYMDETGEQVEKIRKYKYKMYEEILWSEKEVPDIVNNYNIIIKETYELLWKKLFRFMKNKQYVKYLNGR